MERGILREIEDTKAVSPSMDSKRDTSKIYEDKENIDFDVTVNRGTIRKSVLRNFDPLYASPACIKKKEENEDTCFLITEEAYTADELGSALTTVCKIEDKSPHCVNEAASSSLQQITFAIEEEQEKSSNREKPVLDIILETTGNPSDTEAKSDSLNEATSNSQKQIIFAEEENSHKEKPVLDITFKTDTEAKSDLLNEATSNSQQQFTFGIHGENSNKEKSILDITFEAVGNTINTEAKPDLLNEVASSSEQQEVTFVIEEELIKDSSGITTLIEEESAKCDCQENINDIIKVETSIKKGDEVNFSKQNTSIDDISESEGSNYFSIHQSNYEDINGIEDSSLNSIGDIKEVTIDNETSYQSELVPSINIDIENLENSAKSVSDYILNNLVVSATETEQKRLKDMSEETFQEQELSDLKLQLNQCQQVQASLELQLRQKEEVIIKAEAEFQRHEAQYKQEIKLLKEKLDDKKEDVKDDEVKKLKDIIEKMKIQEKKLLDQLNKLTTDEDGFKHIMDEYEKAFSQKLSETEKLREEHDTVKQHLATLELAFADIHQKYERSKTIIAGYKNNEETMQQGLLLSNETIKKNEEKYESLKAHAMAQIDKSNKELNTLREKYQVEFHKLTAIIKRLEIKNASLVNALDQKTKECTALAALCDEVTGHVE